MLEDDRKVIYINNLENATQIANSLIYCGKYELMILYNVTVGIDPAIEQEWLEWMKTVHIPSVMSTGMFVSNKVYQVFAQQDGDNPSYSIQYFAENIEKVNTYLDKYAPALQQMHMQRYQNKHVAFRTLLEEV